MDIIESKNDPKDFFIPLLSLLNIGKSYASRVAIDELLRTITKETKKALSADRCTIFLYDEETGDLWSKVAIGIEEHQEIRIPSNSGLAGYVFQTGETINLENAYNDSRFNKNVDEQFNYTSKSMLCIPLESLNGKRIGVYQVLNKKDQTPFNNKDKDLLVTIGSIASLALENESYIRNKAKKHKKETNLYNDFINKLVNNLADSIVTVDSEGAIQASNQAITNLFNYPKKEIIGQSICKIIPDIEFCKEKYTIKNHKNLLDIQIDGRLELVGEKKDGTIFPIEISISRIEVDSNVMFSVIIRDVTERKEAENLKNDFISIVNHELRTPTTAIIGALNLIASSSQNLPDQTKKLLDIAFNNCNRLEQIINDILDINKIAAGKMDYNLELANLTEIMKKTVEINETYAKQFDIKLIMVDNYPDITVNVDVNRLIQSVTNLLSNAIKFSPTDKPVELKIDQNEEFARIAVVDHGPGIPEDFRTHIFQKYTQASEKSNLRKKGTGLGLTISKNIIEKMNGNIGFTTETNKGTSFYIDLPVFK